MGGLPDPLRPLEPTPVQLTRMEGVLNLVAERVSNLHTRVDSHDADIGTLKSTTQRLSEQAVARDATAVALATALKEADETRRTKTDQAWTPFTRVIAIVSAVAAAVTIYLQL